MKSDKVKFLLSVIVMVIFCGSWTPLAGQARFQSKATGLWSAAGTWQRVSGTSGTVPSTLDTADILAPNVVTNNGSNVNCATLIVESGATLAITGAGNVRVNGNPGTAVIFGTLTMSSSGTLVYVGAGSSSISLGAGGKMTISGSAATPAFGTYSYDPASTVEYTAAANQSVLTGNASQAIVYGNLTLGGSGKKTASPRNVDTTFRCAGTLNVASGVSFDVSTNILRIFFAGDVINYGTIIDSVGVVVLTMTGSQWLNYGTFLPATATGFGVSSSVIFVNTTLGGSPAALTFYDLLVQGTMTVQNGLTVARNVTIAPGGTLYGGSALTHAVGGNWTNNGTFNCGTSTVAFTGKFGRTISGSTFYDVVLNDSLGATLSGNVTVGGSLQMNAGNIATGAYALTIGSSDPSSFSPGTWKVTGTIIRTVAPGSTGIYRLFDANSYVIPSGTGNPGTITATVFPNTNPPGLPHAGDTSLVLKRYYTVTGSGAGTDYSYTLCLSYSKSEVRGRENAYGMWENAGNGWQYVGCSSQPDTVNHYAEQSGLTGSNTWTLGEASAPLPIQLVSFAGSAVNGSAGVRLTWSTASEINNYGFYVQRSEFATSGFTDLPGGFIAGHGTSLSARQYEWIDRTPLAGTNYYRLKQVDLDGSFSVTEPLKVVQDAATSGPEGRQPAAFSLAQNYPNPFNPATRITFTVEKPGFATLKVYNILGDEIATLYEGMAQSGTEYNVAFDGGNVANGAYFYRLVSGDRTSLRKMVLVK